MINNAGISTHSLIEWCPVDSFSKLIDVNTMGPVRVIKTFLPLLRESQGRIIIVASAAGNSTMYLYLFIFIFILYLYFLFYIYFGQPKFLVKM